MKLKKILYGILLASLSCTPLSNTETEQPKVIRNADKKQICINTNPTFHYIINKSKSEGEQDLVNIIQTATVEEAWLFDKINSDWVEIGIREQSEQVSNDDRLTKNINKNNYIHYHIHLIQLGIKEEINFNRRTEEKILLNLLDKSISEVTRENLTGYLILNRDKNIELEAKSIAFSAFPSLTDIMACIKSGMSSAVASEYGVIEYKTVKNTTYTDANDIFTYIVNMTHYADNLTVKAYIELRRNSDELLRTKEGYSSDDTIKSLINDLNEKFNGKIRFEFRPHKTSLSPSVPPLTSSRKRA